MDVWKYSILLTSQKVWEVLVMYVVFYSVKNNNNKKKNYIHGHSWWNKCESLFTAMDSFISEHNEQNVVAASLKASQVLSRDSHSSLLWILIKDLDLSFG